MKDKNIATILSFPPFGSFGLHRFYLGQIGLGILYCILFATGISTLLGFIDFIAFLSMDNELFNVKYNRKYGYDNQYFDRDFDRRDRTYYRKQRGARDHRDTYDDYKEERRHATPHKKQEQQSKPVFSNPFKRSALQKYKEFDFEGAIQDFKKALQKTPNDIAVHFNLACAYSLTEQKDHAFFHLNRAVELGFVDFEKIKGHDALAYLRIQDEFENFAANGFRLTPVPKTKEENIKATDNLLEQLKKLGELRERGLLTEEEFTIQKKKLLG